MLAVGGVPLLNDAGRAVWFAPTTTFQSLDHMLCVCLNTGRISKREERAMRTIFAVALLVAGTAASFAQSEYDSSSPKPLGSSGKETGSKSSKKTTAPNTTKQSTTKPRNNQALPDSGQPQKKVR